MKLSKVALLITALTVSVAHATDQQPTQFCDASGGGCRFEVDPSTYPTVGLGAGGAAPPVFTQNNGSGSPSTEMGSRSSSYYDNLMKPRSRSAAELALSDAQANDCTRNPAACLPLPISPDCRPGDRWTTAGTGIAHCEKIPVAAPAPYYYEPPSYYYDPGPYTYSPAPAPTGGGEPVESVPGWGVETPTPSYTSPWTPPVVAVAPPPTVPVEPPPPPPPPPCGDSDCSGYTAWVPTYETNTSNPDGAVGTE